MSSVELVNNEELRDHVEDLNKDEIYEQIVSNVSFEDLERHIEDDGKRVNIPVKNGRNDNIEEINLHPATGKGEFNHYSKRKFYTIAFEEDFLEKYRDEGLPEILPREELIGSKVHGTYTILENGHKAMITDNEYRSNWDSNNQNEIEAIYNASEKVYSAIDQSIDKTEIEEDGYDIDITHIKDELESELEGSNAHDYQATLEKLAKIPHNANSGTATGSTWYITNNDRFIGRINEKNQKVVIEEIANHNTNKNSMNRRYGGDS